MSFTEPQSLYFLALLTSLKVPKIPPPHKINSRATLPSLYLLPLTIYTLSHRITNNPSIPHQKIQSFLRYRTHELRTMHKIDLLLYRTFIQSHTIKVVLIIYEESLLVLLESDFRLFG